MVPSITAICSVVIIIIFFILRHQPHISNNYWVFSLTRPFVISSLIPLILQLCLLFKAIYPSQLKF
jgi:hypothetical protein